LNVCDATVYNDIKFLTKKSKQYVYDMAKGTHVLMYQRAIEGIGLASETAWDRGYPTVKDQIPAAVLT